MSPLPAALAPLLLPLLAGPLPIAPRETAAVPPPATVRDREAAPGKVYLTVDEALALAFPGCAVTRGTHFLTEAQLERARALAKVEVPSGIVHPYEARKDGVLVGTAWFDTHRVRTHRETLMVVVDPTLRVKRLELLAFAEPEEYVPRGNWYGQFVGKPLSDGLTLKRDIRGVTGATLTARATTAAVRRVLALHEVLARPEPEPEPGGGGGAARGERPER